MNPPPLHRFRTLVLLISLVTFFLLTLFKSVDTFDKETNQAELRIGHSISREPLTDTVAPKQKVKKIFNNLPIRFEPNQGQFSEDVEFAARGVGFGLFITQDDAVLILDKAGAKSKRNINSEITPLQLRFQGASATSARGEDEQSSKTYYFIGNDPAKWRTNVPNFGKVRQPEMYPGVDVVYYGSNGTIEYDLELKPGADLDQIKLGINGVKKIETDVDGSLLLVTEEGTLRQQAPIVYQKIDGVKKQLKGRYQILKDNLIGFAVPNYDPTKSLTIDPILHYSSYLGGNAEDQGLSVALSVAGDRTYIAGRSTSSNLPSHFFSNREYGGLTDGFVARINSGSFGFPNLDYTAYFGGNNFDQAKGITVSPSGRVCITGETNSTDFPLQNPQQGTIGGSSDAFVLTFNDFNYPFGTVNVIYSTYLGGSGFDIGYSITSDASDNVYVTGGAGSTNFPVTASVIQSQNLGSRDAFVTKLNSSGIRSYSTYLGGANFDNATSIGVDSLGNAYVTGQTFSTDFPKQNPIRTTLSGPTDAFVTKINSAGSGLVYSTYLGGSDSDTGTGIAIDSSGNAYVCGSTLSTNFPNNGALQPSLSGTSDAFITKVNATGSAFSFSTYFGGTGTETTGGIALDGAANIYVVGQTTSTNLPTTSPTQINSAGGTDAFVAEFNSTGSSRLFSTYIGGSSEDFGFALVASSEGRVFITGQTQSSNFPRIREFQNGPANSNEAFVAAFLPPVTLTVKSVNPTSGVAMTVTPVDNAGLGNGATEFTRTYNPFTFVEVTAPQIVGANHFLKWQLDGSDFSSDAGTFLTVSRNSTLTAVYVAAPANDNFAAATLLSGASGTTTGSTLVASKESGEPQHAGNVGGASVWYKWQAPSSGDFTFSTYNSSFDTLLAVYKGSAVNALTEVEDGVDGRGHNNDDPQSFCQPNISRVTFTATQGQFYFLAIDGAGGVSGSLALRWGKSASISGSRNGSATVELDGALCLRATGSYIISDVPTGGSYTISARDLQSSSSNFSRYGTDTSALSPLTGNVTGINFVQVTPVYGITGQVQTSGGNPIAATITCTNTVPSYPDSPRSTQTVNGNFSLSNFWIASSYNCVPSSPDFTFTPTSREVSFTSAIFFTGTPNPTPVQITIQTSPAGRTVSIDGGPPVANPTPVQWVPGSQHNIATTSPQAGSAGTRYVFNNWDNGTTQLSRTITTPATATTYTASFTTQHQLTMVGGSDGTVLPANSFFNAGQTVQITATPNSGFSFSGWTGTGAGSFTGTTNPVNITMNGPITQTASFVIANTVQFASASASANESAKKIDITVSRGIGSGTASVNYTTSDTAGANNCSVISNVASSRCDYLLTLGTLQFAPGETSKTISVLITDDVYVEGNENFTITLSSPVGTALGTPSSATLTIVDNDSPGSPNPIDIANFFVRQHYLDFLNREPDAGGLAFWTNEISSCGANAQCVEIKRINVSAAFFLSIEFKETGYLVYRFYKTGFGNLPGAPVPVRFLDFLKDTQDIGKGVQVGVGNWQQLLEDNKKSYALAFVQRPGFTAAFPNSMTADEFVTALNTNAGNVLSPTEKTNLIAMLGGTPWDPTKRSQVLREIAQDKDLENAEINKAFVLMQYFGYLRRSPNDFPDTNYDGFNFWLTKLNDNNGNFINAEMVKAFIISIEYRNRFAP